MTARPTTISRDKRDAPGADYDTLRSEAVRLTHMMSRRIWTDYNYSDPGVTILEQLCYALTELPYRAAFPVRDLLSSPAAEHVQLRRQGLMPAPAILPCNPVTTQDLRRVVIDRVPDVANVWFTPSKAHELRGLSGLYDVAILARSDREDVADGCGDDALIERVLRCYRAHRALCEDVRVARVLRPIDTLVHARAQLEDGADPSDTLASALFALGLYLAPEPRRLSLAQQLRLDAATSTAFAGPLMLRGFIPDSELRAFPRVVPVEQLLQVLAETPGIVAVDTMSVEVDGEHRRLSPEDKMRAPRDAVFWLQSARRDGRFTIHLYRDHARRDPDPARVRHRLDQLWREQRRTYPLRAEYAERFGPPRAHYRDLDTYTSVQSQFPNIYGINANALGPDATVTRKGQAKQLKGYLMPFDQLLADGFSQIALLRRLFSVEAGGDATYAWQSLRPIVPDAEALLLPGYDEGMARLTAEADPVDARRLAILDLLLSLYGQELTELFGGEGAGATAEQNAVLIRAGQTMLRHVASLSRNRGRGADYRRPRSARSVAGMERLSRIQLALLDATTAESVGKPPPRDRRSERLWIEVEETEDADFGVRLPVEIWPTLERLFKPVAPFDEADDDGPPAARSPLAGHRVGVPLAEALADPQSYRIGRTEGSPTLYVVVVVDTSGAWWWLGEYADEARALEAIRRLLHDSRDHDRHRHHHHGNHHDSGSRHSRLYVVDWILLRSAMPGDRHRGARYNFRVTAIVSAARTERDDLAWRRDAETILRRNTPAHVALDCLFLDRWAMRRFERLHDRWLEAMRHCHQERQAHASRELVDFLTRAIEGPEASPGPMSPPVTPASSPEPTPAPTHAAQPPSPMPVPTPTPTPTPTPDPTWPPAPPPSAAPPPTPDPAGHSVWNWLVWFWRTWVWPILVLVFTWRWVSREAAELEHEDGSASEPSTPPPPPNATPAPANLLPGRVAAAPDGAKGFDCRTELTQSTAAAFVDARFEFVARYVARDAASEAPSDLSRGEAEAILKAGLALMVVQHVHKEPWPPSRSLGESYGGYAAAAARAIGVPPGMILWLDLEGVAPGTDPSTTAAYCEAWFDEVAAAGYLPGIYIGANCGLDAEHIEALPCDYYWKSGSSVPVLSQKGYCMVQTINSGYSVGKVDYDLDVVQAVDGKTPVWLALE